MTGVSSSHPERREGSCRTGPLPELSQRVFRFARAISFSYIAFIVSRSSRKILDDSSGLVAHLPAGVAGDIVVT